MTFVRMPGREAQLARAMDEVHRNQARMEMLDQRAALGAGAEANVPVAILIAERAPDSKTELQLDQTARVAVLWIDVPPELAGKPIEAGITSADGHFAKSVAGLLRNANGALALTLPAGELAAGSYFVRLYLPGHSLRSEYRLDVVRK